MAPDSHDDTSHNPTGSAAPATGYASRDQIVAAFMALLAETSFEDISLASLARRADISLTDLRSEFNSVLAVLAAHIRDVDRAVLAGGDDDMSEEPARERLFDVLMRRIEVLTPHKEAIRSLMRSVRRNPPLALALNHMAVHSQQWMLAAAGIDSAGPVSMVRAQGLAVLFSQVLGTWLRDDDPGLARTMSALDRALARGQRWVSFLDRVCGCIPRPGRSRRRRDEDRRDADEAPIGV